MLIIQERGEIADAQADILNNQIGQYLGKNAPEDIDAKGMTKEALRFFRDEGLFTVEEGNDGQFFVEPNQISDETFNEAMDNLEQVDDLGFSEEGRKEFENRRDPTDIDCGAC